MDSAERVCPFCGDPPGVGMFCAACGRALAEVDRLPTRAQWEAGNTSGEEEVEADGRPLAERCAEATADFLATMAAAGHPGAEELPPLATRSMLRRAPRLRGWVVLAVDRDDDVTPRRYTPGLVLTVDGQFHRLDSELRGWGQRDFPQYQHSVAAEALPQPVALEGLVDGLAAILREHRPSDG
jgi:hypothetical protein